MRMNVNSGFPTEAKRGIAFMLFLIGSSKKLHAKILIAKTLYYSLFKNCA